MALPRALFSLGRSGASSLLRNMVHSANSSPSATRVQTHSVRALAAGAASVIESLAQRNPELARFVEERVALCKPAAVELCDGTQAEYDRLIALCESTNTLQHLNPSKRPGCVIAWTDPADVARAEKDTFICSAAKADAGPTNNWVAPAVMKAELTAPGFFDGCMEGRTMYIVPFSMGTLGSKFSKIGVELTDSAFVVANMRIMTRMGLPALDALGAGKFIKCMHSVNRPVRATDAPGSEAAVAAAQPWPCNIANRRIVHFMDGDDSEVWSIGSGYGGNSLLGKKCISLRIASVMAREQGWLAEHMLILGITNPRGVKHYVAAAFPSACGKTNLAMMQPALPGWKIEVVGDDIAWMRVGKDGRLYAVNPEFGFFGVAPGTSMHSNPNAMRTCATNSIFTNVALTEDGDVWWEGMSAPPAKATDWKRKPWTPTFKANGKQDDSAEKVAAHKNSRFTTPLTQCPVLDANWDSPDGVPIDAIVFGGRREDTMPLVFQSFSWQHGTFLGASMRSKATAAADQTGLVSDPMAMKPFIGYNVKDYWQHWLDMAQTEGAHLPQIFHVNWFQKSATGGFRWPGFGENARVLEWILRRVEGSVPATETAIGFVPTADGLNLDGIQDFDAAELPALLAVDKAAWTKEVAELKTYYSTEVMDNGCDKPIPAGIAAELAALEARVAKM